MSALALACKNVKDEDTLVAWMLSKLDGVVTVCKPCGVNGFTPLHYLVDREHHGEEEEEELLDSRLVYLLLRRGARKLDKEILRDIQRRALDRKRNHIANELEEYLRPGNTSSS